jgi:hypothetical protein
MVAAFFDEKASFGASGAQAAGVFEQYLGLLLVHLAQDDDKVGVGLR